MPFLVQEHPPPIMRDINKFCKLVEIRTYRPIEKQKEFCGELTAYDNNSVTIDEEGTPRTFDKKDIALVRLAIDF